MFVLHSTKEIVNLYCLITSAREGILSLVSFSFLT